NNKLSTGEAFILEKLKNALCVENLISFFEETEKMLRHYPDGEFVFVRFDIDRFQLVNAFFGTTEGDKLLKYISKSLIEFGNTQKVCCYGRIEADVFGICRMRDLENPVKLEMLDKSRKALAEYNTSYDIVPSFGIYYITDKSLPVDIMYDRAKMATKPCKGNYINYYAVYDEKMSEEIEREQRITNEMNIALEQNQFVIFLQPKYNLKTNTPAGAEALVRWMHPKNGLISPGQFIPVFERNGFISKLDYYVWEKTCILIRKWLDEGKNVYPISVNISRVNLYNPKLAELIFNLTQKYDIAPALLNLELTESAYVDNPTAMSETMSKLQSMGFVIMMDDFGSGYSSLALLKDIALDVLKIDMLFLSKTEIPGRGENIIASVIR
ncbi:MAG: GGDEF domain-containing phosphodiesterase, partial [Oscillospiraceae bacterium]